MPISPEMTCILAAHTPSELIRNRAFASYLNLELTVSTSYEDPETVKRIMEAAQIALITHADQKRMSGNSALHHIFEVARIATELSSGAHPELTIAGLFHDTIEDRPEEFLAAHGSTDRSDNPAEEALTLMTDVYGEDVAKLVRNVTNPNFHAMLAEMGVEKGTRAYQIQKHVLYAEHVGAAIQDPLTYLLKQSDAIHNTASIQSIPTDKQRIQAHKHLLTLPLFRRRLRDTSDPIPTDKIDYIENHLSEFESYAHEILAA